MVQGTSPGGSRSGWLLTAVLLAHAAPLASGFAISGGQPPLLRGPAGGGAPIGQRRGLRFGGRPSLLPMSVSLNRYHKFSDISQGKVDSLFDKIEKMGLDLGEIDEKFVRGSGAGGQKINKTSSCVQMTHKPTGLQVSCQREREREKNRFIALRTLVEKIGGESGGGEGPMTPAQKAADKKRKQKARRKRRTSSSTTSSSGADGDADGERSDSDEEFSEANEAVDMKG